MILSLFSGIISYFCLLVGVLVSVAFMVLFERKILGYIQIRKGPNKVGFTGVIQSFGDAIKLFLKEQFVPYLGNFFIYYFSPVISLFLVIYLWISMPTQSLAMNLSLGGLFFFCCTSFGVYTLMGSGWSSNSNYALLGSVRGIAQTISYEVSMALFFLCLIFFTGGFSFSLISNYQNYIFFVFLMFPVFLCWMTSILAETNRTPFDFAEGESELVSGFNIEYGSGGFALLFLAEYGSIIFMSFLLIVLFFGGVVKFLLAFSFLGTFFCFWFIWVRGTMPRYRYDKLMYLAWKSFLPISLALIMFFFSLKMLI